MKLIRKVGWKFIEYCLRVPNEVLGVIVIVTFIYLTVKVVYDFII